MADTPKKDSHESLKQQVDALFHEHARIFDDVLKDIHAHVLEGGGEHEGGNPAEHRDAVVEQIEKSTNDRYAEIYIKIGMIAILKNAGESMNMFKEKLDLTVSEMQKALEPKGTTDG